MAGIGPNPGPQQWHGSVCAVIINRKHTSFRCCVCQSWLHLSCSQLQRWQNWTNTFTGPCCETRNPLRPRSAAANVQQFPHRKEDLFGIGQININGLSKKIDEVLRLMEAQNITVMAIQETRLSANWNLPNTPGYVMIRQDRERDSGGGLAFIISVSIQFRQIKLPRPDITDSLLEQLGIAMKSGQQ